MSAVDGAIMLIRPPRDTLPPPEAMLPRRSESTSTRLDCCTQMPPPSETSPPRCALFCRTMHRTNVSDDELHRLSAPARDVVPPEAATFSENSESVISPTASPSKSTAPPSESTPGQAIAYAIT